MQSILMSFTPLSVVVWALMLFLAAGLCIELLGVISTLLFRFQKIPSLSRKKGYPSVSIIKPCCNDTDNEAENFDRFFKQDYPGNWEIIFVVGSEKDPVLPVIRTYLNRYPKVDAKLVLSKTREAIWNKVNSLYDGQTQAKGEIVIWSDSDVIVNPNYVSQMVACLQEPGVSLVTTPQYDTRANTFGSAYKVLANNCDVATFVMTYALLSRRKYAAWGHSSGFKKAEFDGFGKVSWDLLNRHVADDLALPMLFNMHDKKVVFRNIYCPVECSSKTAAQIIDQKLRWVVCQKLFLKNRYLYLSGILFYPQIPSLFLMFATGFAPWTIGLFFGVALSRIFIATVFEALFLNSIRMSLKYFWTIILWDLSQLYFFWHGFLTDEIVFSGKKYRIFDGCFLKPSQEDSPAPSQGGTEGAAKSNVLPQVP
jgi:ceramide glucosyltransferase